MSNLISGKFDNIYKILSDRSLTIISEIPDHLKCVICDELIIKANQAMCGCNFCEKCIDFFMKNEETICPGNSTECKLDNLSNITTNHGLNKQISKLMVKCPDKMCDHECELIDLSDHLSFCTKKVVKCPFNEFGCAYEKLENCQLNDHFQSDLHVHNKILIDMNGNLRNEISELKSDLMKKVDRIDELYKEMNLLNKKNNEMIQTIQKNNGKIYKRFFEIFMKYFFEETKDNETIPPVSRDNFQENIQKEFDLEIQEIMEQCGLEISNIYEKPREIELENNKKIDKLERFLDFHFPNSFNLSIPSISGLYNTIYSEKFTFRRYPYNMRLKCENNGNRFIVHLCISPGLYDDSLKWPFYEWVTLEIFNSVYPDKKKSFSKFCDIERSSSESSFYFFFYHSELSIHGLINTPCTIKCIFED